MFGKLTSTEIEVRDGINYEHKVYNNNGAVSTQERIVTKSTYDAPIAQLETQLALLKSLQTACES